MRDMSAINSINRVIEHHGDAIAAKYREQVPEILRGLFIAVGLVNEIHALRITWDFWDGSFLQGPSINIECLADAYPDCAVGY